MVDPTGNHPDSLTPNDQRVDYQILRTVNNYDEAQSIVDGLSDAGFPVNKVRIVGTGLRTVEQVLTRMTTGKAAGYGALSGVWFGLLIGLLFAIITPPFGWLWMLLIAIGTGALWGAIFGAIGHAVTGGKRDFTSRFAIEAETYDVMVESSHVDHAARVLMTGPTTQ